jgi:hypothetical protein
MDDDRLELVRVDATGTAHPVDKTAGQRMRARQGELRLLPAPPHLVVMCMVGEGGQRDAKLAPVFRVAGEITGPGALCDIVSLIGQSAWKGELVVLDGTSQRSIFFDQGHVVSATSNAEGERLGAVLYRYGALTKDQIAKALAAVTPEVRFGEAAVRAGFITREQLYTLMGRQTEEIVYGVLLVAEGMFYFLDGVDDPRAQVRQRLAVSGLLMEGVRRMDEMRYFRDRIPSDAHVPERAPGHEAPGPEGGPLRKVWGAIDGVRSIADIGRAVAQSEFEVTQALFQLLQSGHVTVQAPRPTGAAAVVALFNEAIALIFRELDAAENGDVVREQLASFATGAGVYDALFRRAGPAKDGTVDQERILANIAAMVGPEQAESTLAQWLYEYVSFAVFVAEPFLRPGHDAASTTGASAPGSLLRVAASGSSLSRRVAELVRPLAPKG